MDDKKELAVVSEAESEEKTEQKEKKKRFRRTPEEIEERIVQLTLRELDKKMRPATGSRGTENFPGVVSAKSEDIRRIGSNLMYWFQKPKAVTDEEIQDRIAEYFMRCIQNGEMMTLEKLALALGYDRRTLEKWESGQEGSTPERRRIMKRAKEFLASFDAEMVSEGKINPVTYIFRAKNYFGMRDQREHVVTPSTMLSDEEVNPAEIKKRLEEGVIDVEFEEKED